MNRVTTLTRFGKGAVALVTLTCLGVCALLRVTPAADEKPETWAAYFPLTVGTVWKYRAIYPGQDRPWEFQTQVRRRIPLKAGGTCAEFEARHDERSTTFSYFGLRKDGYYSYHSAYTSMPGVEEQDPMPQVLFPLKAGKNWKWHEAYRGQIASDNGNFPDTSKWGSDCTATVEHLDAEVTVPAGTYRTIRVRIEYKSQHNGNWEETLWYAKGVGMVRQEGKRPGEDAQNWRTELTGFTPGDPKADADADILPLVRKALGNASAPRTLREIALHGGTFRSRFACAGWGPTQNILYQVSGKKIAEFDPERPEDWSRLITEDKAKKPGFGALFRISMAQDMGILIAEARGFKTDAKTDVHQIITRVNPDATTVSFTVRRVWNIREGWADIAVQMEINGLGEIVKLKAKPIRY